MVREAALRKRGSWREEQSQRKGSPRERTGAAQENELGAIRDLLSKEQHGLGRVAASRTPHRGPRPRQGIQCASAPWLKDQDVRLVTPRSRGFPVES